MKINFPEDIWDKVMSLSRLKNISSAQVIYLAINSLYKKEGQKDDKELPKGNRTE